MTIAPPLCCSVSARLTTGREIYPHRSDLHGKRFYKCDSCGAFCGCHPGTTQSLGKPADAETRRARSALHDRVMDPIWRNAHLSGGYVAADDRAVNRIQKAARARVYQYLAYRLGVKRQDCHTGMFTLEQCRQAAEILRDRTYPEIRAWCQANDKRKEKAA